MWMLECQDLNHENFELGLLFYNTVLETIFIAKGFTRDIRLSVAHFDYIMHVL
jgi:hypothetical protein